MRLLRPHEKHHNLLPMPSLVTNLFRLLIPFDGHKSTLIFLCPHHLFADEHSGVLVGGGLTLSHYLFRRFLNDVINGFLFRVGGGHTLQQLISIQPT